MELFSFLNENYKAILLIFAVASFIWGLYIAVKLTKKADHKALKVRVDQVEERLDKCEITLAELPTNKHIQELSLMLNNLKGEVTHIDKMFDGKIHEVNALLDRTDHQVEVISQYLLNGGK